MKMAGRVSGRVAGAMNSIDEAKDAVFLREYLLEA